MKKLRKTILASMVMSISIGASALTMPPSINYIKKQYEPSNGVMLQNAIYEENQIYFTYQENGQYVDIFKVDNKYYLAGIKGKAYDINICGSNKKIDFRDNYELIKNRELVIISVDGLNVLNGKPANFNQGGYVIEKRPTNQNCLTVKGWRKSLNEVAQFTFENINNSYNAKSRNDKNNIGVIGFAIFDEKGVMTPREVVSNITRDESSSRYEAREKSMEMNGMQIQEPLSSNQIQSIKRVENEKLGTGHGKRIISQTQEVVFEKEYLNPNQVITIEYKSYEELESMGIIKRKNEAPNAFPGNNRFTPDPKF